MMLEDVLLPIVSVITLLLTVLVLSYYLARLRKLNSKLKEASEIIESIVTELRNRMTSQDKKIMDQEVKLEILELKVAKFLQPSSKEFPVQMRNIKGERVHQVKEPSSREAVSITRRLTETEKRIFENLSQREYTATELQNIINKTREHTSRILKKLLEDGYIERDERKRPYVYRLLKKDIFTSV